MRNILLKGTVRLLAAMVICGLLTNFLLGSNFMVELGNQIALGQMENSNFNYNVLQLYNQMRHTVLVTESVVLGLSVIAIIRDIYQYIKNKKEKN